MHHIFMERFNNVPANWKLLDEKDYTKNGIMKTEDVDNLATYIVGKMVNANRTGSFLYYGEDADFIKNYYEEMTLIQKDYNLQEDTGLFPAHIEKIGNNAVVSVIKLIKNPSMYIVDIMMNFEDKIYSYHTYIEKTEKNLWINYLATKYEDIKFVVEKFEN